MVKIKGKKNKEKKAQPAGSPSSFAWPEGDKLFHVRLDGVEQGAVLAADSKEEAKSKFQSLFGIISTERTIKAVSVSEDHGLAVYDPGQLPNESTRTSGQGIVNYRPRPNRAKPEADEEDDD